MNVRRAELGDIAALNKLLYQVLDVHYRGRPDLFREGQKKYTDGELAEILADRDRPVFVACGGNGEVLGYAFCVVEDVRGSHILTDQRTLYIDDICVDESSRGMHVGHTLYNYVREYARKNGFRRITLNVWSCNESAMRFYEKMGLVPYKVGMEEIL